MEHRRLDEDELAAAETDRVSGLHDVKVPRLVVVAADARLAPRRNDERGIRAELHHRGEAARVVRLGVLGDDVVDRRRIHDLADILHELVGEPAPHRVHQRDLLIDDEK